MLKRTFYLDQIKPFMHTNLIKIIVGIRRAGKSTLLKQIIELLKEEGVAENEIIYLNFEDYSIKQYKDDSLLYEYLVSKLNKNKKTYILLDEIQEVNNFEKVVNSLNATENVDIYITGSNSKILSG
ncbi:MAG: AAA family ATPase [Acholeplasmataceae bacterium]|nr:AAA family ATPase [Acholeplasmataceae bacterium]